jgi:hypothetical protein
MGQQREQQVSGRSKFGIDSSGQEQPKEREDLLVLDSRRHGSVAGGVRDQHDAGQNR